MFFEVGKTYKTRDGRDAKLVHRFDYHDRPNDVLLWVCGSMSWRTSLDGKLFPPGNECRDDVMPPIRVGYVNIYNRVHECREAADYHSSSGRIACVRVEYHEGQFDD